MCGPNLDIPSVSECNCIQGHPGTNLQTICQDASNLLYLEHCIVCMCTCVIVLFVLFSRCPIKPASCCFSTFTAAGYKCASFGCFWGPCGYAVLAYCIPDELDSSSFYHQRDGQKYRFRELLSMAKTKMDSLLHVFLWGQVFQQVQVCPRKEKQAVRFLTQV